MNTTERSASLLREGAAVLALTVFMALALIRYSYANTLSEYDLYSTALGVWHGEVTGQGLGSPLHYYLWLAFGYVAFLELIAPAGVLADEASLVRLMNVVGIVATIAIPFLSWTALRGALGAAAALAATTLFVTSPVFLDIAGTAHPLLPALAMLLLGMSFMAAPTPRSWRGLLAWAVATFCFVLALLLRFEVAFAFPFYVLLHPATESLRAFVVRAAWRSVPGIAAIAGYFAARQAALDSGMWQATGAFLDQWYSLGNLAKGIVALVLAVGAGLAIAAAYAVWTHARAAMRTPRDGEVWRARAWLLAPLALMGVALAVWLPNPLPARHFLVFTFGLSVLVAATLASALQLTLWRAVGAAVLVSIASQVAAFATAPLAARLSPSDLQTPVGVLVPAPAEPAWRRREILKARSLQARDLSILLAEHACPGRLVVITDQAPALLAAFLRNRESEISLEAVFPGAFRYRLDDGAREIDFIQREGAGAPIDPLASVLADPRFQGAMIFVDPMTRRRSDIAQLPAARRAPLDC